MFQGKICLSFRSFTSELADWFSKLEMLKYEGCMKYDDAQGELHYDGLVRLIGRKPEGEG